MTKLLLCISEEKESIAILEYCNQLAQYIQAELKILLVTHREANSTILTEVPLIGIMNQQEYQGTIGLINRLITEEEIIDVEGWQAQSIEDSSELLHFIREKYAQQAFDLLILPRSKGMSQWPFKESLHKFLRSLHLPMLILDPSSRFKGLMHVIFASDYQSSDVLALQQFDALFTTKYGAIEVVHVSPGESFQEILLEKGFQSYVKDAIPNMPLRVTHVPANKGDNTVMDIFISKAEELIPDLIVCKHEDHSLIDELFQKSFTFSAMRRSLFPLLILHEVDK